MSRIYSLVIAVIQADSGRRLSLKEIITLKPLYDQLVKLASAVNLLSNDKDVNMRLFVTDALAELGWKGDTKRLKPKQIVEYAPKPDDRIEQERLIALRERIKTWVEVGFRNPVKEELHCILNVYRDLIKNKQYSDATLRLELDELEALGETNIQILKDYLYQEILKQDTLHIFAPDNLELVIPTSDSNVIQHEREHGSLIPDTSDKFIDLTFVRRSDGQIGIAGITFFEEDKLTSIQSALAASEPRSLSRTDIDNARARARSTNDPQFLALIEQRIKSRKTHNTRTVSTMMKLSMH